MIHKENQGNIERDFYFDGLRAIAIIFVLSSHFQEINAFRQITKQVEFGVLARLGVYIFFFISGYVIYNFSIQKIKPGHITEFYLRRLARLLPAMLFYLLSCLTLGGLNVIDFEFSNFISSLTYLTNTTLVHPTWYAGHTWSLSFEEQFYVVLPLFLVWASLNNYKKFLLITLSVTFVALPLFYTINPAIK